MNIADAERLLVRSLAAHLGMNEAEIAPGARLTELGIDSISGLRVCRDIGESMGIEVDLEWIFDHATVRDLAEFIAQRALATH